MSNRSFIKSIAESLYIPRFIFKLPMGIVILAGGVNDRGFCAAALYFPGYAVYDPIPEKSEGKFGVSDSISKSVAPLHWIISDKDGQLGTASSLLPFI